MNCYSLNPLDVGKTLSDLAMHDSDVISALDISGAAEIKTGSFTGKLTGGYYNASQLRKSQINFVVRVMVCNSRSVMNNVKSLGLNCRLGY